MIFNNFIKKWPVYCQQQVIQNITREWQKFADKILPTRIFWDDVNSNVFNKHSNNNNDDTFNPIFIQSALNFYSTNLHQWINQRTSFGVIYQHIENKQVDLNFLNRNIVNQSLSLILFCQKQETLKIQQMLTRARFHWYRKLSKSPLNSGFQTSLNDTENIFNITYQAKQIHKNGKESEKKEFGLDHILMNRDLLKNNDPDNVFSKNFDVIICKSYLKNCLAAFLDDSFSIVSNDRIVLKLSPLLVPFKLALTIESSSKKITTKLYEVAEHLINSLQEHPEITIFPFVPGNLVTVDQCDKLAVKYCIILKEETLKNGVIYLRNRDTLLSEMVHISNLLKTILFNLHPEKLITYQDDKKNQIEM